jgi:hypothetical protein
VKVEVLADDLATAIAVRQLLARAGVEANARRVSVHQPEVVSRHVEALEQSGRRACVVDPAAPLADGLTLAIEPSIEAWLTRDLEANREVLGAGEVPPAELAKAWLAGRTVGGGARQFTLALDGRALADRLDLGRLAAFAPGFRELVNRLNPGWGAVAPVPRRRGRPPGVALFRGTGVALCLELLHLADGTMVRAEALAEAVGRTKTPVRRFIDECVRRGYLRRTSPRGPLVVRNRERLLEDLVADRRARHPRTPAIGLSDRRDPVGFVERLARRLGEHGRVMAITGARAVADLGGDHLIGGPTFAYAPLAGLDAIVGDSSVDDRAPQVVLIEPDSPGLLHRLRPGIPARVSPWQAAIDLLASPNSRERETGELVRDHLFDREPPR